jgi:PAS domain S-box-containing protein
MNLLAAATDKSIKYACQFRGRLVDRHLLAFLNALPLPVIGVGRDGRTMLWNPSAERFFGWKAEEVLGQPLPTILADEENDASELRRRVFNGEVLPRVEVRRARRDGSVIDAVLTTAGIRDRDGSIAAAFAVFHDLSDLRDAQRRFRSAELRYQLLLDSATEFAVLFLNAEGRLVDWNRGADHILGSDRARVQQFAEHDLEAARAEGRFSSERELTREDGTRFWAEIVTNAITDAAGRLLSYIVVARDTTERKRVQDELQRRSTQSAVVADFAQRAIAERDPDALARSALEHLAAAIDADSAELLAADAVRRTLRVTHCFDRERGGSSTGREISIGSGALADEAYAARAPVVRALDGATYGAATAVAAGEEVYVLAAYSAQPIELHATYPLQAIAAMHAAALARTNTEARLSDQESSLRLMLEQLPAVISIFDRNLTFVSIEGMGLKAIGHQPQDLIGHTMMEIEETEGGTGPVAAIRKALAGEAGSYEYHYRGRMFDNRVEPLRDREGEIVGAVNVGVDVTDRRAEQVALSESRTQLRRLSAGMQRIQEDERRRIAREVHDELGQRLTALRLDLGLLRSELRSGDAAASEKRIETMFGLVDETIGTVRRVATELRPAVLDDFGFRAALENELSAFSSRTGIAVDFAVLPEDIHLESDRATALYRILQEALTNVARHSGATRVELRVEAQNGSVEAELRDNGRGITAEQARSISTLGLLGIRERAVAVGGSAKIERLREGGTRVLVSIPI